MPNTIQADDLADLVLGTLRNLGRLKIENIAQSRQDYQVVPVWMKKKRMVFDDGYGIQQNLYNAVSGNARHVGLFDEDEVNIPDLVKQLQVPWRHAVGSWGVEYRSDVLMNRGPSQIVNLIKLRREDCALSLIEEIEDRAWGDSPVAADDTLPYSVKYWIVKNNTVGFNGGLPSDHTTVGGVNLTNSPNFKNYTGQYTTVSKADLIKKMRTMHRKINFKSPITLPEYAGELREDYKVYTNESVIATIEDVGEAQNENLGRDIASMDGGTMAFRGHPIVWVPALDDDTTNPVYLINHATFKVVVLKGCYFLETRNKAPHQHMLEQYFSDISYNYACVNRRRNGVLATNT